MPATDSLQQMYEELANRYARQGEARQRDHCLVLAADAALSAGQPEQAERLRKRLLLTNPHHFLRPFASMAEAMQSTDVQDYVADLRGQWPPEAVQKLVRQAQVETEASASKSSAKESVPEAPPSPKTAKEKKSKENKTEALTLDEEDMPVPGAGAGFWLAMMTFVLGALLGGGLLVLAFGGPFLPW